MKYTLVIAIIAALTYSVTAYCPNLCSGHGTCQSGDTCSCYKYTGTARGDHYSQSVSYNSGLREAWTGADCSLRTCPLAYSWSGATPNGLVTELAVTDDSCDGDTHQFEVSNGGATLIGDDSFKAGAKIRYGSTLATSSILTIRAVAFTTTNTITFYEAHGGNCAAADTPKVWSAAPEEDDKASDSDSSIADSALDANGAHGMLECAGQGLCDRSTGECECFPGYEGEACTRSVCPNSCSGHGICLALYRLASDASKTYNQAWDHNKHYGCKCDIGFRGPDCSLQECPSDFDPLYGCGGGECNLGGTDSNGDNCPNTVFSDCENGVHGGQQRDCSGRGICDYETGVCKCFAGFYGEACSQQTILI